MDKGLVAFKPGKVFNPIELRIKKPIRPLYKEVSISFPSRLNAMAIDPSLIDINKNHVYTAGEILFSVNMTRRVSARIGKRSGLVILGENQNRKVLIEHSYWLMKQAVGFTNGVEVELESSNELYHFGFGSSSGMIASVASAINELYGKPISDRILIKYVSQNHGEEIENKNLLYPVQSLGGSAASGMSSGSLIVIAGESEVIASMKVPNSYRVIAGVPKDFRPRDSKTLMDLEVQAMEGFIKTGEKFGRKIAYRVLHELLPAVKAGDLKTVGDVIYDYRYNMGSIKNCAYAYPPLPRLMASLRWLKLKGVVDVLSVSSVGPTVFAVTKNIGECKTAFREANLLPTTLKPYNSRYKIISRA